MAAIAMATLAPPSLSSLPPSPPPPNPLPRSFRAPRRPPSSSGPKQPPADADPNAPAFVSWSSSIARLSRSGQISSAASAFSEMLSDPSAPSPNEITLLTLLSACADFPSHPSSLPLALSLHSLILKLHSPLSTPLSTALLHLYSKHSLPSLALRLFDRIPHKNSFSFNAMLSAHLRNRQLPLALSLFRRIPPPLRDKFSYTSLLRGLLHHALPLDALLLFRHMQTATSIAPDYVTLLSLASACASLGSLSQGMWVHRYSLRHHHNVRLSNSLVDLYSRCGRVDLAHQVFASVTDRTPVTWNSMIVGFALNGRSAEALEHFAMMKAAGFEPDGVSYTGALTACSHAGLVEEGLRFYEIMTRDKKVELRIEHYGCVVDLLARSGRLEEAMRIVESMAMRPNEVVLGSLLAACRVHGDVRLAERVMDYLMDLEPKTDSNYVLLSNVYASAGKWDGAGKVRNAMKSLGVKKQPGFSTIEVDGGFHEFVAGDRGHPHTRSIYDMLDLLFFDMKLTEEVGHN